ncbi:MAG: site-specific integrase [Phycisphaerae bacterium]|nr:site-specific integrase [Phycisphaerae bacterium]
MKRSPWGITRDMFLSIDEVEDLLGFVRQRAQSVSADGKPAARLDQVIIECLLFSGLRNSEFCSLRLADTPVVSGKPVFEVCGPRLDQRSVYIPAGTAELVCWYAREVRPLLLPDDVDQTDPTQPLLFNDRRSPFERTGLYRRVVRILSACGLGDRASVQLLRHTYGYLAYLRTGGNLLFVQRQLGHAHPMVTVVYAQFVDERYEELAQRICETGRRRRRTDSPASGRPSNMEFTNENDERSAARGPGDRRRHPGARTQRSDANRPVL